MTGIFMESTEELGLLVNRYKDIPEETSKFMDKLKNTDDSSIIQSSLEDYKRIVRGMVKTPEPINPRKISNTRKIVSKVRKNTESLIGKLKSLIPRQDSVPSLRNSIKWIEKVIIDLLNLCDQDLNLLSLVQQVYYRNIYESDFNHIMSDEDFSDNFMETSIDQDADMYDDIFESYYQSFFEEKEENDKKKRHGEDFDELTAEIKDPDEKYYPLFCMSVAYNYGPAYTFMAPIIHSVTNGDEYTHSYMSFDPEFKKIVTFGGKGLEYMKVEDYEAYKYSKSNYISVVWLTKDEMNNVKKCLKDYHDHPEETRFSLINFFTMMLGKAKRKDKSHCCSAFLGYLLNISNKKNLTKDYSMTRPEDVTLLPRAYFIGTFSDLEDLNKKREEFKRKTKQIYDDNIDDIREYNNSIPKVMLTANLKKNKHIKAFYKNIAERPKYNYD